MTRAWIAGAAALTLSTVVAGPALAHDDADDCDSGRRVRTYSYVETYRYRPRTYYYYSSAPVYYYAPPVYRRYYGYDARPRDTWRVITRGYHHRHR